MITRAQIRRQLRKEGGIMNVVPRQGYISGGIGGGIIQGTPMGSRTGYFNPFKVVKKGIDKVLDVGSKVIKSPVGKAALLGAGLYGLGGGFGSQGFGLGNIGAKIGSAGKFLFGAPTVAGNIHRTGIPGTSGFLGKLGLTKGFGSMMPTALGGITGASLLTYFMS